METFSKSYLNFVYYIAAHPYKITWKTGFQARFSYNSASTHYWFWIIGASLSFLNSILCWSTYIAFAGSYIVNEQFVYIGFHILWATVSLLAQADLAPHLFQPTQVLQVVNGCFALIDNLEKRE